MFIYSKKDMITYMGKQISISMNVTAGGAKQHWNLMISITKAKSMLRYLLFVSYSSVNIMLGCGLYF